MRLIIAFCGLAGSGKDTAATEIFIRVPSSVRVPIAEPIRCAAKEIFLFSGENMADRVQKETPQGPFNVVPRKALQLLGFEFVRQHFGGDFWIRHLRLRLDRVFQSSGISCALVTDLRMPDEVKFLREYARESNGRIQVVIVQIQRKGLLPGPNAHALERGLDPSIADVILRNGDCSEAQFCARTWAALEKYVASAAHGATTPS